MSAASGVVVPPQSAPPLAYSRPRPEERAAEDRGRSLEASDRTDQPLFVTVWYLFFQAISTKVTSMLRRLSAIEAGIPQRTQSQLAAYAATLTAANAGQLVEVTDFAHVLRWSGSGWAWGPGDTGSGTFGLFEIDPGVGWHLYDGTANVPYLKSNGTTGTRTLPDLVSIPGNAAYPKAGSPNSGVNAATAPGFTGGAIASAATGITATTSATATTEAVTITGVGSTATAAHTHAINVTDPHHTHAFSGGAVDDAGEPQNIVRRPWFRQ